MLSSDIYYFLFLWEKLNYEEVINDKYGYWDRTDDIGG